MDKVIDISVKGSYIRKNSNSAGIQGEGNVTTLHITFDDSWESYAKKVTFWDSRGENPVERTLTADLLVDVSKSVLEYNVPIPAEPLVHEGEMTFVIEGYIDGKRKRAAQDTLEVEPALVADNAGEPADPTPTQAEQLQKGIDAILSTVKADKNEAIAAANRAETEADRAKTEADNAGSEAILAGQYADAARDYSEQAEAKLNEAITEAGEIVNTTAIIANRAANSAVEAGKAMDAAKASAESIAIDEAYMQGVVDDATAIKEEAKGYSEVAKHYSEVAQGYAEGDYVTNAEFQEAINNLKDIETTSDKVFLTDEAKDSMNFRGDETLDDALTLISSALDEVYENMEQTNEALDDYLPINGSKAMNGPLQLENGTAMFGADYKQWFLAVMDDVFSGKYGGRILTLFNAKYGKSNVKDALVLTDMADDGSVTEYRIYGEHNKPTAADVGALPIAGGTLTGNLFLKDLDNTSTETARIFEYAKSLFLETSHSNGYSRIQIDNSIKSDLANSLIYGYVKEGTSFSGNIFGQHNKPSGRYTGNSDATAREISIGGIQGFGGYGLLWVTSSYGDALVGAYGALVWSGNTVKAIGKPSVYYYNGILYLATADNAFNISGQNYTYYVL